MKLDFFLDRFSKNTKISNFTKIRLVGAEFVHAEGRMAWWTDGQTVRQTHDEANCGVSQLCERA